MTLASYMKMQQKKSYLTRKIPEIFGFVHDQQHTDSLTGWVPGSFYKHGLFWFFMVFFITCCSGVPVVGLHPKYPTIEKKTFAVYTDFVEVDSLQPTFRWESFPRPEDHLADRIQSVTYEFRIWRTIPGQSGKLRYLRTGLKSPYHKLEKPLEPSSNYLWSIRARFMIDGYFRVIEWGLAGMPLRNEAVPNSTCFRFKTPAK